jgi:hypothetical protein
MFPIQIPSPDSSKQKCGRKGHLPPHKTLPRIYAWNFVQVSCARSYAYYDLQGWLGNAVFIPSNHVQIKVLGF